MRILFSVPVIFFVVKTYRSAIMYCRRIFFSAFAKRDGNVMRTIEITAFWNNFFTIRHRSFSVTFCFLHISSLLNSM